MKKDNRLKTKAFPPEPTPEEWDCYTDLALEQRNLLLREAPGAPEVEGIQTRVRLRRDLRTTWIRVSTPEGSAALRKPMGTYVTLEVNPEALRMKKAQDRIVRTLAGELADLMALSPADPVLVVGLGNRKVIYDALGPLTLDQLQVTGHLRGRLPAEYGPIRSVFAFEPGVLGRTGMETGSLLQAVADALRPAAILAVDALAARNRSTLCATIQLTDTRLVPHHLYAGTGRGFCCNAPVGDPGGCPVFRYFGQKHQPLSASFPDGGTAVAGCRNNVETILCLPDEYCRILSVYYIACGKACGQCEKLLDFSGFSPVFCLGKPDSEGVFHR